MDVLFPLAVLAPAEYHLGVTTRSMLHQIACKGYAVNLRRPEGRVIAEAISMSDPSQRHISRSYDGDGEEDARKAVRELARMVGIAFHD